MRVDGPEPRPLGGRADQVIHRLARERLVALGDEQPGQPIRPRRKIALDGAQLGAGNWLLDRQAVLQALHPQPRLIEVDLVAAKANRFADAQPVAVHYENEQMVTHAVPPGPGRVQERLDLARGQKVFRPLVRVGGRLEAAWRPLFTLGRSVTVAGGIARPWMRMGQLQQLSTKSTFRQKSWA